MVNNRRQSQPFIYGWHNLILCGVFCFIIAVALFAVAESRGGSCEEAEASPSCLRAWLSALAPWAGVVIALIAIGPVIRQWNEMRRQNLLSYSSLLQTKIGEYESFRMQVISVIEVLFRLRTFLVGQPVNPNKYPLAAFEALLAIGGSEAMKEKIRDAQLVLFAGKIIGSNYVDMSDIKILHEICGIFGLIDTAMYGQHNRSFVEDTLGEFTNKMGIQTSTWFDIINAITLATEAGGRISKGVSNDMLQLRNQIDQSLDQIERFS